MKPVKLEEKASQTVEEKASQTVEEKASQTVYSQKELIVFSRDVRNVCQSAEGVDRIMCSDQRDLNIAILGVHDCI